MDRDEPPPGLDADRPSEARIYDYLLGGSLNFAVDRAVARDLITAVPTAPLVAQANRAFLRRAVRFLVDAGVRQFLDIGSGVPTTRGNVHQIARRTAPECRVVYVDVDPVAVSHSRQTLAGEPSAAAVLGDARQIREVVGHPEVRALLDFGQPVAALLVDMLHFIPDADQPARITRELGELLCPGSYLAISHLSNATGAGREALVNAQRMPGVPVWPREHPEITAFFAGFDLVDPGFVRVEGWQPEQPWTGGCADSDNATLHMYAGVGRKG